MNLNRAPILALFAAAICIPTAYAGESVVVAARETQAVVSPGTTHLRLVKLPALDFALRAAFNCTGTAESLTLSIADTHDTLGEDTISGQRSAEAILTVPPRQLALASGSRFCLADDLSSADELLVPGLATAHASLRCRNDEGVRVHFTSAPLQVRLLCERPPTEDQDPSPDK